MGVVELVPLPVAQPEPVAAEVVPADREHGAVGDGEQRGSERREDVLAVMPADAGPGRAERVGERRRPVDREDVPLRGERRRDVGRRRLEDRAGLPGSGPPAASAAASSASAARRRACAGFAGVAAAVPRAGTGTTGVEAAASAWPTRISVPAGSPPWSAVSTTRSAVTEARALRVPSATETRPPARASPRSPSRRVGSARSGSP